MKKEINKKTFVVSTLLCIIFGVLIGLIFGIYFMSIKDTNNNETSKTTTTTIQGNAENKLNYEIQKTDVIGKVIYHTDGDMDFYNIEDEDGNIRLSYPQFNSNDEKIIELNNNIKLSIEKNIDDLNKINAGQQKYDSSNEKYCLAVKMMKSGNDIVFEHFGFLNYVILESENYFSLIEMEKGYSECASGYTSINQINVINKFNNKILSNIEIAEIFNIKYETLKEELKLFLKEYFKENAYEEVSENDINNIIDNDKFNLFISEKNNLVFSHSTDIVWPGDLDISFEKVNDEWVEFYDYKL